MNISQQISIQLVHDEQDSQTTSIINVYDVYQPPENFEHSFFYKPYNDTQIYLVTYEEIPPGKIESHLNVAVRQTNLRHQYYFQHSVDKKIYKIICDVVPYNSTDMVKYIHFGSEHRFAINFSKEHRENLKLRLSIYLNLLLEPIDHMELDWD